MNKEPACLLRKQQQPETGNRLYESISTTAVWLEENSSIDLYTGSGANHVLSQTVHLHDVRAFVHEQATSDHVQTRLNLTSINIFIRVRVENTPLPMQQN